MTTTLDFHFVNRFQHQAKTLKNHTALRYFENQQWHDTSWASFQQQVDAFSLALLAHHIDIQDKIGIFAHNMPRWTIADIGTLQTRAITVPIYATNTAQQAAFIINDADIKILFVGDQAQYDQAIQIADQYPQLQHIVAMKDNIELNHYPHAYTWEQFIAQGNANRSRLAC